MAITVTGTGTMTPSSTATQYDISLPSGAAGPAIGRTTLVCLGGSTTDVSARTFPSGWEEGVLTASGSAGVLIGMVQRTSYGWADNLDTGNQPGDTVTITTASATATARSGVSATIDGGYVRSVGRCNTSTALTNGGTVTMTTGSALTGNKGGLGNLTTTTYAASGDVAVIFMCSNRHNAPPTLNTGGNLSLTNVTNVLTHQGNAAGNVCLQIWTADVGATLGASIPTLSITDNASDGQTVSVNAYVHIFSPNVDNPQEGAGGDRIRISVIGDSITHGSGFSGFVCAGGTPGTGPERWIDRLFGVQSDAVAGTIVFGADDCVSADTAATYPESTVWYNGTYTPYDGSPTTNVRVRNMGMAGYNAGEHVREHRSGNVAAREDVGESADILILCLGANDEREGWTATQFRDNLVHLATVFNPAPRVLLVKQWAWAADIGDTWNRVDTHANIIAAIDDAAALITGSGRECVVVDCAVDAVTSGGTNIATQTAITSCLGAISPSASPDNIHPSATYQDLTWRAAIQTGLDQFDLLNPASGGGGGSGTSIPDIPTIPTIPSL